jgi:hypothetical protein
VGIILPILPDPIIKYHLAALNGVVEMLNCLYGKISLPTTYVEVYHPKCLCNYPQANAFPFPPKKGQQGMWMLFGSFFHVLQLLPIRCTQQTLILHQQIYDETSTRSGLKIGPPLT